LGDIRTDGYKDTEGYRDREQGDLVSLLSFLVKKQDVRSWIRFNWLMMQSCNEFYWNDTVIYKGSNEVICMNRSGGNTNIFWEECYYFFRIMYIYNKPTNTEYWNICSRCVLRNIECKLKNVSFTSQYRKSNSRYIFLSFFLNREIPGLVHGQGFRSFYHYLKLIYCNIFVNVAKPFNSISFPIHYLHLGSYSNAV
jgi:hypothetical protein